MVIEEMGKLMSVIKSCYPAWAKGVSIDETKMMISVWHQMLKDYNYEDVRAAIVALIATETYPPSIAAIIEKIRMIKGENKSLMTGQEAWALVRKALKNGLYHAKQEYDKLPAEIQSSIGDHYALKAWAEMSLDELETVIQSQFIKSYKVKSGQKQEYDKLPSDVKAMIENTTKLIGGN